MVDRWNTTFAPLNVSKAALRGWAEQAAAQARVKQCVEGAAKGIHKARRGAMPMGYGAGSGMAGGAITRQSRFIKKS